MKKLTKLASLLGASLFALSAFIGCYSGSEENTSWVDGGHTDPFPITFALVQSLDTTGAILDPNVSTISSISATGDKNISASLSGTNLTLTNAIAESDYVKGKNDSGTVNLKIGLAGTGVKSGYTQDVIVQLDVPVTEIGYIKSSGITPTLLPPAPSTGTVTLKASDVFDKASTDSSLKVSDDQYYINNDAIFIMDNNFYFYTHGSSDADDKRSRVNKKDGQVAYLETRGGGRVDKNYFKFPVQGACEITVKYVAPGSKAATLASCVESDKESSTQNLTAVSGAEAATSKALTEADVKTATFSVDKAQDVYIGGDVSIGIVELSIDYGN